MLSELSEIKKKRKKLGITQTELSKKTGVSQSLIAKIEAGAIVPSYTNAKKLFDFFEILHEDQQAKAGEFMTKKVVSAKPDETIKQVIKKMEKNSVSQLPIIEDGKNIGTISEKLVLEQMNKNKNAENALEKNAEEIMEEAMPEIRENTPFEVVSSVLSHYPGAVVVKNGRITGIITKSDLLKTVISQN